MVLIDKIKAIADAIRNKTGVTAQLTLDEMAESIEYLEGEGGPPQTFILVDEEGREITAVRTDEVVELTATPNDIRIGTTAVTDTGVTVGEKEIPAYITTEGRVRVSPGDTLVINMYTEDYKYTRLQALMCTYNTSITDSVATTMIATGDKVYDVMSTVPKATVTSDDANKSINFGVINNTDKDIVIRYLTYRED